MFATILQSVRVFAAALLLAGAAVPVAEAGWWTGNRPTAAGHATPVGKAAADRGDPATGVVIIAVAVVVFVLLAWLAARIGDAGRPADKGPY
jgi:hypothetical protein